MAKLTIQDSTCTIVQDDGSTEDFIKLRARAYTTLPEALRGTMDRLELYEKSGNLRVSFDTDYFPAKGNMSQGEYAVVSNTARAKKLAISGAIIAELIKANVPIDHFTVKDSWFRRDKGSDGKDIIVNGQAKGSYQPTCQIWLNQTRSGDMPDSRGVPKLHELKVKFLSCFDDLVEGARTYQTLHKEFGDDETTLLAILENKISRATIQTAATPVTKTEVHVDDDDDEMPQD